MLKDDEADVADTIANLKKDRRFAPTVRDGIRLVADLRQGNLEVLFELFPWVKAEFMQYIAEVQGQVTEAVASSSPKNESLVARERWLDAEEERLEAERAWQQRRQQEAEASLEAERQKVVQERKHTQKIIDERLARLEQLLLEQGNQPIRGVQTPISANGGGNGDIGLRGQGDLREAPRQLDVPIFDIPDDDDDIDLLVQSDEDAGRRASQNFLDSLSNLQT